MNFSFKKNIIIIVIAAVLALGIGGTVVGVNAYNSPGSRVSRYLGAAERYLSEMNYEQAVIEFKNILKIEPMNVDAYLGLADAYIGMGDTEKALEVLREGLEKTGDTSLQSKIDELTKPAESSSSSSAVQTSSSTTSDTTSEPVEQSDDEPKVTREYDEENRLVWEEVISPDGTITDTQYGEYYDDEGNVTGWGVIDKSVDRLDENGDYIPVSEYHYSEDGTLNNEYQYNDRGDLIKDYNVSEDVEGETGTTTSTYKYEYGPFGVLSKVKTVVEVWEEETQTYAITTNYTYDAAGKRISKVETNTWNGETDTSVTTNYTYDAAGKLISETEIGPDGSRREYTEYKYDSDGRRIERHSLHYRNRGGSLSQDETETWKYNDAGRRIEHYYSSRNNLNRENTKRTEHITIQKWDDAGRKIEDTTKTIRDGQLVSEDSRTHSYDEKSKTAEHKYSYKGLDRTRVSTSTHTYNENGRVVHRTTTTTYTDGRQPKTSESVITWVYEYDELGRVILETGHDEDGNYAGKWEYEY